MNHLIRNRSSSSRATAASIRRLSAALFVGSFMLATPMLSNAQDAPPPPGEHRPGFGRGGHHGGPFMHELKSLDLSEAQRASIRTAMKSAWESGRSQHDALRSLQRAALLTPPSAPNYGSVVNQLADAEANAARDRVQRLAALKGEIYGMLTDAQKATLNEKLKNLPEPPTRGARDKGGFRDR